jgi:hypothetical protein
MTDVPQAATDAAAKALHDTGGCPAGAACTRSLAAWERRAVAVPGPAAPHIAAAERERIAQLASQMRTTILCRLHPHPTRKDRP